MTHGRVLRGRTPRRLEIFLVAAEESGDRLGGALMRALRERASVPLRFSGVGGREMTAAGLDSLLPIDDFSIIGFSAIPRRLPRILQPHVHDGARGAGAQAARRWSIIDSPGYTLWVARCVRIDSTARSRSSTTSRRRSGPGGPGGRRSMRRYIDHVLALLPFEPDVHRKLGGPPCSYVGPSADRGGRASSARTSRGRCAAAPTRRSCWRCRAAAAARSTRLAAIFGETLGLVAAARRPDRGGRADRAASARAGDGRRPPPGRSGRASSSSTAEKQAALRIGARGARQIRHRHARARHRRRADGRRLQGVAARRVGRSRRLVRVPSYILANLVIGRERRARDAAGRLHAEALAAALAAADRRHAGAAAPARGLRPARCHHGDRHARAGRPAPPTSCLACCAGRTDAPWPPRPPTARLRQRQQTSEEDRSDEQNAGMVCRRGAVVLALRIASLPAAKRRRQAGRPGR